MPALARFLSPDPAGMGSPYVYVQDDPLDDTDPTGELNWNSVGKVVEAVVVAVAAYFTGGAVADFYGSSVAGGAAGGFVAGFAGSQGNLEDGAIGAVGGAAMGYFGGITGGANATEGQLFERGVAEGLVGGTLSTVATHGANGSFASGFLGAFAAAYVGGGIYPNSESGTAIVLRTAAMAVVGGTAAEVGGGSFANGAISAAFQQLFNEGLHRSLWESQRKELYVMTLKKDFPVEYDLYKRYAEGVDIASWPQKGTIGYIRHFAEVWKEFTPYAESHALGVLSNELGSAEARSLISDFVGTFHPVLELIGAAGPINDALTIPEMTQETMDIIDYGPQFVNAGGFMTLSVSGGLTPDQILQRYH